MLSSPTEKQIENQILTYLRNRRVFVWKNQSVGVFDQKKNIFRRSNNPHHIDGVSDILGLYEGRFLAIEVKRPSVSRKTGQFIYRTQEELIKKASSGQVTFIDQINKSGGCAFLADSLEVVKEQMLLYFPSFQN